MSTVESVDAEGNVTISDIRTILQLQADVQAAQAVADAIGQEKAGQMGRIADAQATITNAQEQIDTDIQPRLDAALADLAAKSTLLSAAQAQMPQ